MLTEQLMLRFFLFRLKVGNILLDIRFRFLLVHRRGCLRCPPVIGLQLLLMLLLLLIAARFELLETLIWGTWDALLVGIEAKFDFCGRRLI